MELTSGQVQRFRTAQWAYVIPTASQGNWFNAIALDASGNIYAAGVIKNNGAYDFGNNITVAGSNSSGRNALLVKFNSSGTAQWAKSVASGSNTNSFESVVVDGVGGVYVAGYVYDTVTYDFGNNVKVTGALAAKADPVLVKYAANGAAQWAKSAESETNGSNFNSVSVDSSGSIYAAGGITNTGTISFGNGVSIHRADRNQCEPVAGQVQLETCWAKGRGAGCWLRRRDVGGADFPRHPFGTRVHRR